MGSIIAKFVRTTFEILNEIYISIGAGCLGLIILAYNGVKNNQILRTILISAITAGSLIYVFQSTEISGPTSNKVVFITGCDSGLGFSLAQHMCELGFTVLAGCLRLDSKGAKELRNLFGDRIQHIEVDITRTTSVEVAVEFTERFLKEHPSHSLWAIINNAGIMVFGEFEWLTEHLIQDQLEVNLAGTFRITKAFCPLLRYHKGRIITISSHCALATLPGLAVYGATKAGLVAWSDGLRVELSKYDINVVTFIPGSFALHSNIMARQKENCHEMQEAFTVEQKEFYGDYFNRYNSYLSVLAGPKAVRKIDDPGMYKVFEKALLEIPPKTVYVHEPLKYSIYHKLFKYSPVLVRDYLVTKFMQMPQFHAVQEKSMPEGLA